MSEIGGIYNIPGEGFIVEIIDDDRSMLFDRRGLQYRILQRKQQSMDTSAEESALLQINNFNSPFEHTS